MLYKDGEKYFTQAPEVVNDLTTGGTTKALSAEQGKVLKNTIDNLPQGGHTIKNDSGTSQTQRDNLQFGGVYTHDDSTNNKTKVDIVREFQSVAEIEALTGEAQKGFQVVQDAEDYIPFTASENIFDNTNTSFTGDNVQDVLEEVDGKLLKVERITGFSYDSGNKIYSKSYTIPTGYTLISILTYMVNGNVVLGARYVNSTIYVTGFVPLTGEPIDGSREFVVNALLMKTS